MYILGPGAPQTNSGSTLIFWIHAPPGKGGRARSWRYPRHRQRQWRDFNAKAEEDGSRDDSTSPHPTPFPFYY